MPDDEKPPDHIRVNVPLPPEFLQEAAKRGATPEELVGRLAELAIEASQIGKETVENWDDLSQYERFEWVRGYVREWGHLEYPQLDDDEQSED